VHSRRLLLAALVAALGVAAAAPSVARAEPCWQRVIKDWTKDGVITKRYSPHCLRTAIKKTPEDLRDYSSIIDDINAALLDSLGGGTTNGPNDGGTMGPRAGGDAGPEAKGNASPRIGEKAKRAVPDAGTAASAPADATRIPLPLILLASVLAACVLAVASPPLIKRFRTRFPRLRPGPGSVRPPA
jgi:hypothetical protein